MNSWKLHCYCDYFDVMNAVMLNLVMCVARKVLRAINFKRLQRKIALTTFEEVCGVCAVFEDDEPSLPPLPVPPVFPPPLDSFKKCSKYDICEEGLSKTENSE